MYHLGLTGNIASGKSAVSALLAAHGATIIDADVLAREAVAPGNSGFEAVVQAFGAGTVRADGTLDRAALRARVFRNPAERATLNAIVHPAVGRLRALRLGEAKRNGDEVVVSDIPLLYEAGLEAEFDGVLFVDAAEDTRLERLMDHRGLSRSDALAMMNAQWPAARKRALATWVIDNDGSREQLEERVAAFWTTLPRTQTASSHSE